MSPIVISPHASRTIYFGSQFVHRSRDRGDHWDVISADLTTNDDEKLDGNVPHCTITTLAESPVEEGLLLAGTDDGNVWVSRNGGDRWIDLTDRFPGLPANLWVSRVAPSHKDPDTFYVSFTGYREDLRDPFVFMTTDGGEEFISIASNLPQASVNVVREHPRNADVLLVGTETGVFVSIDAGARWHPLRGGTPTEAKAPAAEAASLEDEDQGDDDAPALEGQLAGTEKKPASSSRERRRSRRSRRATPLPMVPVHDLVVHPRDADLIIATHGRGIYVMDIAPLEDLGEDVLTKALHVFPPRDAYQLARGFQQGYEGHRGWKARNPSTSANFHFYVRDDLDDAIEVRVLDAAGNQLFKRTDPDRKAGLHTVTWRPSSGGGRRSLFGRRRRARFSGPGEYVLRVTHGKTEIEMPFSVHGATQLDASAAAGR